MSTAVAKRDTMTEVCTTIAGDLAPKIKQALPAGVDADRFVRVALTAVQQNPDLLKQPVKLNTVYNALVRCASDGLLPDGREAALVRFGDAAQYMPMVGGFLKIAAEHDYRINAQVVYALDDFSYELAPLPTVSHVPPRLGEDRGDPIGAYAIAEHPSFGRFVEVMSRQEVEQVRAASRSKGSGPWAQWWGEMARKTATRRLFKRLPLASDERAASVADADDATYDLSPGPLADLPTIDPSEEYEPVEGEIMDDGDGGGGEGQQTITDMAREKGLVE